eukprot:6178510-Pleurochrysis_carterae.AAC.1
MPVDAVDGRGNIQRLTLRNVRCVPSFLTALRFWRRSVTTLRTQRWSVCMESCFKRVQSSFPHRTGNGDPRLTLATSRKRLVSERRNYLLALTPAHRSFPASPTASAHRRRTIVAFDWSPRRLCGLFRSQLTQRGYHTQMIRRPPHPRRQSRPLHTYFTWRISIRACASRRSLTVQSRLSHAN